MFLTKIELQGFKTFAQKTSLSFLPPTADRSPITAVVGPNGSGKSNLSDAIRWVLGEQSMKLLRGKESQDIIFSGSDGRGRAGFAEVSISFNNEDKTMPIDFSEVTVTRRLYRDGDSEYLMNGQTARLSDIQLLLAQANVGQRSYSVIGQGMVDHILVSSPEERKAFFDDATGVKPLQIKRHEAMLKLKRTYENLAEAEMLLAEIEPRVRSLKRQVNRLQEREEVERSLWSLESQYYGTMWWQLTDELAKSRLTFGDLDAQVKQARGGLGEMEARVAAIEKEEKASDNQPDQGLAALQKRYNETQRERSALRDKQFQAQKEIELSKVRAQSTWAPLPLTKIIEELDLVVGQQKKLLERIRSIKTLEELRDLEALIDASLKHSTTLVGRLQRPNPEDVKPDPTLLATIETCTKNIAAAEETLHALEEEMRGHAVKEKKVRTELIDLQRELRAKQQAVHELENRRNAVNIELARLDERQQNLHREIDEQTKERAEGIRAERPEVIANTTALHPEIQRLRYKIELIGGIDPEIVKEFEETNGRFTFLSGQIEDLRAAIEDTEEVIDELDEQIHAQAERAFKKINEQFQHFFKILFGGGSCSLVRLERSEVEADEKAAVTAEQGAESVKDEQHHHEEDTQIDAIRARIKEREERIVGIDIQATPPGKKLKALGLLSGGERALTSIALVAAIMAVNPGPFVVLDEVDAALDEANTYRFAAILEELAKLTQFIIITHNRATMEKADVLYGVSMGAEGISSLLSVKLADVTAEGTARR